jgi:preprotein translocase subunit SecA
MAETVTPQVEILPSPETAEVVRGYTPMREVQGRLVSACLRASRDERIQNYTTPSEEQQPERPHDTTSVASDIEAASREESNQQWDQYNRHRQEQGEQVRSTWQEQYTDWKTRLQTRTEPDSPLGSLLDRLVPVEENETRDTQIDRLYDTFRLPAGCVQTFMNRVTDTFASNPDELRAWLPAIADMSRELYGREVSGELVAQLIDVSTHGPPDSSEQDQPLDEQEELMAAFVSFMQRAEQHHQSPETVQNTQQSRDQLEQLAGTRTEQPPVERAKPEAPSEQPHQTPAEQRQPQEPHAQPEAQPPAETQQAQPVSQREIPPSQRPQQKTIGERMKRMWERFTSPREQKRHLAEIRRDLSKKEYKEMIGMMDSIQSVREQLKELSPEELRQHTTQFKERLQQGESLDALLPDAYAHVVEVASRELGIEYHDVQVMAGIMLHKGKITEMKTGEGKTLVAALPLYLNALEGKGAHLVTSNDYLAKSGAGVTGKIFQGLGMSVAVVDSNGASMYNPSYVDSTGHHGDDRLRHWKQCGRNQAYAADITYGTAQQFGFDYLRDNMATSPRQLVQRDLHYAIIDEADNILIDEARTPLVISTEPKEIPDQQQQEYLQAAEIASQLTIATHTPDQYQKTDDIPDGDISVDPRTRTVIITEQGYDKIQQRLNIPAGKSLGDTEYNHLIHVIDNAIQARMFFQKDKDYTITNGEVTLIDQNTGRPTPGRKLSHELHQAIEAKENVPFSKRSDTAASITLQSLYGKMYDRIAGMTGTAYSAKEELADTYGTETVRVPSHKENLRTDESDIVSATEQAKWQAVVGEVIQTHQDGRPVLIGTASVEESEHLRSMLESQGLTVQVLNATNHEQEGYMVAQAGRKGVITISTNMAGRGTDIMLGGNPDLLVEEILREQGLSLAHATAEQKQTAREQAQARARQDRDEVVNLGGLHVVGTCLYDSQRITDQLRGRAGRQGDPGSSIVFLSAEDQLIRRMGVGDSLKRVVESQDPEYRGGVPARGLVGRLVTEVQGKIEGAYADARKSEQEKDEVMHKQRSLIYADRRTLLVGRSAEGKAYGQNDIKYFVEGKIEETVSHVIDQCEKLQGYQTEERIRQQFAFLGEDALKGLFPDEDSIDLNHLQDALTQALTDRYHDRVQSKHHLANWMHVRRQALTIIDAHWQAYQRDMGDLWTAVATQAQSIQKDPKVLYKKQAFDEFQSLKANIGQDLIEQIMS